MSFGYSAKITVAPSLVEVYCPHGACADFLCYNRTGTPEVVRSIIRAMRDHLLKTHNVHKSHTLFWVELVQE